MSSYQDASAGYTASNLIKFSGLGGFAQLVDLRRLDEGEGIIAALTNHQDKWHKSCTIKYENTRLQRVLKKKYCLEELGNSTRTPPK